ncbi:hypothetical protein NE237_011797 [Protea cynaroides]|uniref:Uncharacterized protein n=1 Tax=Protea cynaroides TaxID=273540 RepID=A0A9Q0H0M2_9MAGN|nr:hypothetical protein NE237_011797 [Protea cynaroides]
MSYNAAETETKSRKGNYQVIFNLSCRASSSEISSGKKTIMLNISGIQRSKTGTVKSAKCNILSSGLEIKLDELWKELFSIYGEIPSGSIVHSTDQYFDA